MNNYFKNKKLVIFDLDDTLILEREYVISGLCAVSKYFSKKYSQDLANVSDFLLETFESSGRERIFDKLLHEYSIDGKQEIIIDLVNCYRNHYPNIKLSKKNKEKLIELRNSGFKLAIVTDGLELMQRNKVNALELNQLVDAVVYCWSISAPKPDTMGFKAAMRTLSCSTEQTIIIGDNPEHDIKPAVILGVDCLRVLTGRYASLPDLENYTATAHFESLQSIWE
ncbi:HAD family hydrolase [Kluyvera ascorbata]|uniref:HAD family hydrolase n=1 Tax=Kluyvera ascorbata TaxID=51288 RepID=UPI00374D659B